MMQEYILSSDQSGLESWPNFEDEGVEVLEGNPQQSGRIDWGNIEGPLAAGVWECTPGKVRLVNPFLRVLHRHSRASHSHRWR